MENSAPESLIVLEKHPKEAQPSSTKENLVRINTLLESQINTAQSLIASLGETNTNAPYLSELKDGLNLLQKHIEFTLDALNSSPEQFNKILQEKSHDLSPEYVKLSTIEDINLVMLDYILDFIANDLLLKFQDALDTLSKNIKSQQDKSELVNINDTFDWIQILIFRLNLVNESYPCSVTYSKTDLFSFPKTSQVWQELEKVLVVKKVATKEDVEKELDLIFSSLRSMYAIIKTRTEGVENPEFPSAFGLLKEGIKYRKTPARTRILSLLYLRNPTFDAFRAIKLADDPWIEKLATLRQQHVGYDKCIYVPRDFPAITKELLIKEYEEKTLNKLHSNHSQHEKHNEENAPKIQEPPANLFLQTEETIRVRILAPEPLNLQNNFGEKISTVFHKARKLVSKKQSGPEQNFEAIVIHIHGGGFVAGSSAAHRIYLNHWVNNLKMVHFSIDYRLAPEHRYPAALDDVWQAYLWIINNATPVLGIRYQKIIITGDSAGGNLATALTYRLLRAGLRAPDGCLLLYPSVLRITNLCSPSSLFSLDDPIIPYKLHRLFNQAYMPEGYELNMEDPFLRPLLASDELLSSLPPVRVVIGSADLLHDNCLRFVDRLRKLNKEVKMVVYESLPHGFYNMSDLKCYQQVNDETCDLVRELCALADRKDV